MSVLGDFKWVKGIANAGAKGLVSSPGLVAAEEGMEADPPDRWLGQKQERSLQATPVGEASAALTQLHFF